LCVYEVNPLYQYTCISCAISNFPT
jgi:hypothetical protein